MPEGGDGGGGGGAGNLSSLRLTLASGHPVYSPQPATPTSTDTTAETVTFSTDHGWVTGTICTVSATVGGLTAGTIYYLNVASSTTVSFHTTVAAAEAGTGKVNLTASITSVIIPSGVSGTNLYLTPGDEGNGIDVYDAGEWTRVSTSEVTKALGTLTADTNYDVFTYLDTGAVVMELVAWTSDLVRATSLARDSGRWVKSGSTRLYVGTIRTNSTTTAIDDYGGIAVQTGGKRWIWNAFNKVQCAMFCHDTGTWSYSTETWRASNNNALNSVSFVNGLNETLEAEVSATVQGSGGSQAGASGVGFDSTTFPANGFRSTVGVSNVVVQTIALSKLRATPGFHTVYGLEIGNGTATLTWFGGGTFNSRLRAGVQACLQG